MKFFSGVRKIISQIVSKKESKKDKITIEIRCMNPIAPAQYEYLVENQIATVEITVSNPGPRDIIDFQIQVRLQDVSDWCSKTCAAKGNETTVVKMIIPCSFEKLYNFEEKNLNLDIHCAYTDFKNKKCEFNDSRLIKVLARDDMVWAFEQAGEIQDLSNFIAAWVTPRDPDVQKVIHSAAEHVEAKSIGGIVGYQEVKRRSAATKSLSALPNQKTIHKVHLRNGALLVGLIKNVTGGANNDINFYLMNSYEFLSFNKGLKSNSYLKGLRILDGYRFDFLSTEENDYYLVFDNSFSTFARKSVIFEYQVETPLSHQEIVKLQVKAIYETIKQYGMNYVDASISFAPGCSQRVQRPCDTIKYKGGNCIDGSVLFASCFEAIGLEPFIAITGNHALVGVKTWQNTNRYFFIETTCVGSFDFTKAIISHEDVFRYGQDLKLIDIKNARTRGIKPLG